MIDASVLQLLLAGLAGWLDRREREVIGYLVAENRLLRRQLGAGFWSCTRLRRTCHRFFIRQSRCSAPVEH